MGKKTKVFTTGLLTVFLVFVIAMGASAATGTKSLSAIFRNIKLNINGKVLQTADEPFIIGGRTYVPLRVVSETLGAWVDWNQNTNVITIAGKSSGDPALEAQLMQKDIQIAQLQAQIEELKKGQSATKPDPDKSFSELRSDLKKDYDELEDVEIDDIRLSGNEDNLTVNIEVDLDDFDKEWKELTDSKIKSWVGKVCADIQDYYGDDTNVSGKIIDTDSDDTLITFKKDGTKSLSISYKDDDYRKGGNIYNLEDDLKDEFEELGEVTIEDIRLSGNEDDVDVVIEVDLGIDDDEWADLSDNDIEDFLEDLCNEIQEYFNDDTDIDGDIIDTLSDDVLVMFDKDGDDDVDVDFYDGDYR